MTLLSGFPFINGLSEVHQVDPDTGADVALVGGLGSAIDVIALIEDGQTVGFLTLEYSPAHRALGAGRLQLFDAAANQIAVLAADRITPSSMAYDRGMGTVIVAEINTGKLVFIPRP